MGIDPGTSFGLQFVTFGRATILIASFMLLAGFSKAQEVKVADLEAQSENGILIFKSQDKDYKLWMDNRVYFDGAYYFENLNQLSNGLEIRRARFGLKSVLWGKWGAEIDIDFAGNEVDFNDAYVKYHFNKNTFIKTGNFKEPFSLETVTTSRNLTFMERSYVRTFAPKRNLGAAITHYNDKWFGSLGFFGQEVADYDENDDEGYAITGRMAYFPIVDEQKLLHFAVYGTRRTPNADPDGLEQARFRHRPETFISRKRFVTTGKFNNVSHFFSYGVEGAANIGPFSIQSEMAWTDVKQNNTKDYINFSAGYVLVAWNITGEPRRYDKEEAEFRRILPENEKTGAFQVALRYSTVNLNDFDAYILGGNSENVSLAINWYFNPNVKWMLNFVYVNNDRYADGNGSLDAGDYYAPAGESGDDFGFIQTRVEVDF